MDPAYLQRKCRICFNELENEVLVFGDEGRKMLLQSKIRKYLHITITKEDSLPKTMCRSCCKKLEYVHRFASMAIRTQEIFNKISERKENENKSVLHTYITKGIKENNCEENEITEMEVKVDPMLILQCSLDENSDDFSIDAESSDNDNVDNKSYGKYECRLCCKQFLSDLALGSHCCYKSQSEYFDWQEDNNGSSEETKTANNLQSETENLIGYTCPICAKLISTKGNLKVHLESHRPKGKFGCHICGRIFKTQCNLLRHKEYHKGIQFPCSVCGRVYPTNSTLRAHSITHSNLRPHKCPLCVKTFKRNQDLKFHINQHTGARPYQCPYCPKAFASSGNCFSHRKRMHPKEVERDRERASKIMR